MNAHIDLDFGIAAEEVMRQLGQPLDDIHDDFQHDQYDPVAPDRHRTEVQLAEI